jgi:plasmid maintenance system antidote protein VapI
MNDKIPVAECFPLSDHLVEELEVRDWSAADLVRDTWMSEKRALAILCGSRVTPQEAECLAGRLGVSPDLLLNLQTAYAKWLEATSAQKPQFVEPNLDVLQVLDTVPIFAGRKWCDFASIKTPDDLRRAVDLVDTHPKTYSIVRQHMGPAVIYPKQEG